jgi:hypothetical protein
LWKNINLLNNTLHVTPLLTPFIILVIFSWTQNTFFPSDELPQKIIPHGMMECNKWKETNFLGLFS